MALKITYACLVLLIIEIIIYSGTAIKRASTQVVNKPNFTQMVMKYGYKSELHNIVTEDGYILKVFRLIPPDNCSGRIKSPPVLLMHGYLLSADAWVVPEQKTGLAYLIADLCFDLWIGNFRGNVYSRHHVNLNPDKDFDFWNFSHTELGKYDLPAIIDYLLKVTGADNLNYIGFSQGASSYYIMCSEKVQYRDKVKLVIALSPSTRHLHTRSPIFRLTTQYVNVFKEVYKKNGYGQVMFIGSSMHLLLNQLCKKSIALCDFFKDLLDVKSILHPGFITEETIINIFDTFPAGTSMQNAAHFGQLMTSSEFKRFDYGTMKNLEYYGTRTPPAYNLSVVATPVVVIYGPNDGLVDPKDILWSTKQLPNVLEVYQVKESLWAHLDFAWSTLNRELVLPKVSEYLLKYSQPLN